MFGFRRLQNLISIFILSLLPLGAQAQPVPPALQWAEYQQAIQSAYKAGHYDRAIRAAEAALTLAERSFGKSHPDTFYSLNMVGAMYQAMGRYEEAEPLFQRALKLQRRHLGNSHQDTIITMGNLATLYMATSRYGEAESLYTNVLDINQHTLGYRHPATASAMHNLAGLYVFQGRLEEAETLLKTVVYIRRETLGEADPRTLNSLNTLASTYQAQGRLGEAETILRPLISQREQLLGAAHPSTLTAVNDLALVLQSQSRHEEAVPFLVQVLALREQTLGDSHPETQKSRLNLAAAYFHLQRFAEALPMLERSLEKARETLGESHTVTLSLSNNLGALYMIAGRVEEAELELEDTYRVRLRTLGADHPETISSASNLARYYALTGQDDRADRLISRAVDISRTALGPNHPTTLALLFNDAIMLGARRRPAAAAQRLETIEEGMLTWLGAETYGAASTASARATVAATHGNYQIVALNLAAAYPDEVLAQRVAASTLLRFKGLQAEEEAVLARLMRRMEDPSIKARASEIRSLRDRLARAFHKEAQPEEVQHLTQSLDRAEQSLAQLSRAFREQLVVRDTRVDDVRNALSEGDTLVEFARYQPLTSPWIGLGQERWGAVVITGHDRLEFVDLGPSWVLQPALRHVSQTTSLNQSTARLLYDALIRPLELDMDGMVFVSPDGPLHLLPFGRLIDPDGRFWAQSGDVHIVQTGRDLVRPNSGASGKGLLAIGGVDFGALTGARFDDTALDIDAERSRSAAADVFRAGFAPLPASTHEVESVAARYTAARPGERVEIWRGAEATETRLLSLLTAPRVLHLATHGFYRVPRQPADRPMLLSGIALAGANTALKNKDVDGVLYALEAQGLNLEGTELVVLSACETAQGVIGYGEGVYGMVRALRTAGAENVLVALRPIGDQSTAKFMRRFYSEWLSQAPGQSDPARALLDAQAHFIETESSLDWSAFVMVGR